MNLIFTVTGLTSPHPPSVRTAIPSAAQLLSGVVQTLMQPQLWGTLNAEDDDGKTDIVKESLSQALSLRLLWVCHIWLHQYNTSHTQNAFLHFFPQCLKMVLKHGFSRSFLNGETTMVNSALVVSLGSPSCTSYKLSKSAIRIQCDFPQRDPAGICAACVTSRLGQCIFSICHLRKKWKKKTRWNSPCEDEHHSDS